MLDRILLRHSSAKMLFKYLNKVSMFKLNPQKRPLAHGCGQNNEKKASDIFFNKKIIR